MHRPDVALLATRSCALKDLKSVRTPMVSIPTPLAQLARVQSPCAGPETNVKWCAYYCAYCCACIQTEPPARPAVSALKRNTTDAAETSVAILTVARLAGVHRDVCHDDGATEEAALSLLRAVHL